MPKCFLSKPVVQQQAKRPLLDEPHDEYIERKTEKQTYNINNNESWLETVKSNNTVRIRMTKNTICKLQL